MPTPCPVGDTSCGQYVYSYANFGEKPVWMTHAEAKSFRGETTSSQGGASGQTGARRRNTRKSKKNKRVNRKTRHFR